MPITAYTSHSCASYNHYYADRYWANDCAFDTSTTVSVVQPTVLTVGRWYCNSTGSRKFLITGTGAPSGGEIITTFNSTTNCASLICAGE